MSGDRPCGPYLGASNEGAQFTRRRCSAPSLLEAHTPRPPLGAFSRGGVCSTLSSLRPARGNLARALKRPQDCSGNSGGKNQAAAPREVAFAPSTFKNHFEPAPPPSPTHKRPSPGGPISTNAREEPHPSGAPYKKPIPNSRFLGVHKRPDTPLRLRFHVLQESPELGTFAPSPLIGLFTFSIFSAKI